jgi:hypothetical protein
VGQPDDLGGQPPLAGLQGPPVGVGEAGNVERQQLREGALGLIEARLELARRGTQGRHGAGARGRHGATRVPQQRLAGGRVGRRAPGRDECLGLPCAQAVARHGVRQARLVAARQRRQDRGRGGGEPAGVDVRRDVGREPPAEREPAIDPAPAATEQLADLGRREVIALGKRADHASLIHGAQGPSRRIRLQQAGLGHDAGGVFDDHGHMRVAGTGPVGEALEAVEHLVGAIAGWSHPQRQRGEDAGPISPRSAQRCQRGGEPVDRDVAHDAHGRGASTGRSWESG